MERGTYNKLKDKPENQFNKSRRKIEKQKQNKKLNLQT